MLLVSAMTAALFAGCGSDGNQTSGSGTTGTETDSATAAEEGGIKKNSPHFFGVAGSEINDDNEIQQIIADKTGVKVKGNMADRTDGRGSCRHDDHRW